MSTARRELSKIIRRFKDELYDFAESHQEDLYNISYFSEIELEALDNLYNDSVIIMKNLDQDKRV